MRLKIPHNRFFWRRRRQQPNSGLTDGESRRSRQLCLPQYRPCGSPDLVGHFSVPVSGVALLIRKPQCSLAAVPVPGRRRSPDSRETSGRRTSCIRRKKWIPACSPGSRQGSGCSYYDIHCTAPEASPQVPGSFCQRFHTVSITDNPAWNRARGFQVFCTASE